MDHNKRLFSKGFILFITISFSITHSFSVSYATDKINGDFLISQDQPVIISVDISPDPNNIHIDQNITIQARTNDLYGITEVWALINATYSPPVFTGEPERHIVDLPRIDLKPKEGLYEGTYEGFIYPGPYSILVFAKDTNGHVSLPYHQSIEVTGEPRLNAMLIAGWEKDTYKFSNLLSHAQWVLQQKGFSQIETLEEPTLQEIENSLKAFDPNNMDQLLIYLIGPRDPNHPVSLALNASETLNPDTLEGLLSAFSSCTQVVLIDTPGAQDFFKETPNRIYVCSASSGEEAYLEQEGYCAFSHFFFTCIFRDASVFQAYNSSSRAMENYSNQTPWLEDGKKWKLAQATYLGSPFIIKRAGPRITVPRNKTVRGYETLWAQVKDAYPNTIIWALVKEPGKGPGELKKVTFSHVSEDRYEATYLFPYPGTYEVYTYIQGPNGLIDYDKTTYVQTGDYVKYNFFSTKGWSMLSLPVETMSARLADLTPAAIVLEFQTGVGYVPVRGDETLKVGRGYWFLHKEAHIYTLIGHPILKHTLMVSEEGWQMIGGCTHPARVSVDNGHIAVIYGFVPWLGYQRITASEDIEPARGYWILIEDISNQAELRVEIKPPQLE